MNWHEAVASMRLGKHVRRTSEKAHDMIDRGDDLNPAIIVCGTEPTFLCAAWTDSDTPVRVFMGAWSKVPFVPDDEHRAATDWEMA